VRADVWHEAVPPSPGGRCHAPIRDLALPDEPEQQIVTYAAQVDTESQTALDLLASIAAEHEGARAHEPDDQRAGANTRS
jgi:hypothetical protein